MSAALKDSHGEDRVRETIRTLEGSKIGDIARYGRGRPGLIPLWFGEGDLPTPAFICDAASQALKEGRTFYTAGRGVQELREALKRISNWPTYPQLYVKGELLGGCDITLEMFRSGELKKALDEAGAT